MHVSPASIWWSNVSLGTTHARTSARAGRGGRGNDKCVAQLFRAWTHTRRGTVFDELTVTVLLILVPVCACGFVWARERERERGGQHTRRLIARSDISELCSMSTSCMQSVHWKTRWHSLTCCAHLCISGLRKSKKNDDSCKWTTCTVGPPLRRGAAVEHCRNWCAQTDTVEKLLLTRCS
jgi:hypothetical protein